MTGLLTLRGATKDWLVALLDSGQRYVDSLRDRSVVPPGWLAGRTVTTAFFEPSTRTRLSFEKAAHLLGAHVMSFTPETSSVTKGESLKDTVLTLTAMGTDVLIVRHSLADGPELAARWSGIPVINAGAGRREHPTQTLIDVLTLRQRFGDLDGLRMAIVGDVRNSRVARGHLAAMPQLGVELTLIGPSTLLPAANPWGVRVSTELDEELGDQDVVYLLRVQEERGASSGFPTRSGYAHRYGITGERLSMMKPSSVVMHPGPLNRGMEIDEEAAESERSLVLAQVANGVPMRMAVLEQAGPPS